MKFPTSILVQVHPNDDKKHFRATLLKLINVANFELLLLASGRLNFGNIPQYFNNTGK